MTIMQRPWWKDGVVYQIYPASFKDSNGDGIGDIPGITQSLDYIKSLGVNIIWVCPMYDSPQIDMGYDISNYEAVYPPYGTVADMEELIQQCHARGMRVLLDLVINHTSDQHKWFQESRSSKTNPKRDWYIWRPAKYDEQGKRGPPNNWRSNFGGSVWEWDEHTEEYFLHLFCPEQPDLNWENEETREAIYASAMTFWLDKGVDGFRVDTVNMYSKPPTYPDARITDPGAAWQEAGQVYCNGPRMHEFLGEMNNILSRYGAMTVGECPHTPDMSRVVKYVSAKEKQLDMVFQFDTVDLGMGKVFKYQTTPFNWSLKDLKESITRTQGIISGTDAWTTVFMENHDQARCVSRFGDDSPEWRVRSGKMLALMNAALSGTLYIYQGQEIGMINLPRDLPIDEYKDIESGNYYKMVAERSNNDPVKLAEAHAAIQHLARDHARSPMQWTSELPNGGFTGSETTPWMRVNPYTADINVSQQLGDKESVMAFWKRMLEVRRKFDNLLVHGDFSVVDAKNQHVFSFVKNWRDRTALVVCNFSGKDQPLPNEVPGHYEYLAGNVDDRTDDLEPWEGRIYLVD
ncbi:hypothetical protein AAFC00_005638 [Neodothiora populina]|uniref:Glycosyl hydrolase family 13 catalytic domain-containing protein n=1 Tax=Neodothiora populina TaxID=2781224 RepID=A0ABR3PLX6_9PEZI